MDLAIIVAGDGIELRPIDISDAESIWAIVAEHRADLRTWLPWVDFATSVEECRRHTLSARNEFEKSIAFDYGIHVEGSFIGTIGTHIVDWQNFNTTLGYWISPGHRGRGIVTRAAAALIEHAIANFRIHRFEIQCVVENTKSRRIPERLDFVFEAVLADRYYLHEQFRDIALYGMTATRWAGLSR